MWATVIRARTLAAVRDNSSLQAEIKELLGRAADTGASGVLLVAKSTRNTSGFSEYYLSIVGHGKITGYKKEPYDLRWIQSYAKSEGFETTLYTPHSPYDGEKARLVIQW